ncbi:MAG TPA: lipoyl(octanoyl) transferase [Flavobacteriales bacterium]|jgi:lipoyl(octanoyl) transferase|nr:lipoyl(octanoyl) transferase [Flavobacteriales bacterium]
MRKRVLFRDLGKLPYKEAWDYQESLLAESVERKLARRNGSSSSPPNNYLLFVEHPHVYTLGKSGDMSNLLLDAGGLEEHDATFYKTNRGGDITYHGPGQLVGYPILDLDQFNPDINVYLRNIEEVIILTLADFGIRGERFPKHTGVWVDPGTPNERKICAIGVKTARWITMHGFALNVNTQLNYFDHIIPCGLQKGVASMHLELGEELDISEVAGRVRLHFSNVFQADILGFAEND